MLIELHFKLDAEERWKAELESSRMQEEESADAICYALAVRRMQVATLQKALSDAIRTAELANCASGEQVRQWGMLLPM